LLTTAPTAADGEQYHLALLTSHRCLIFLGDLERYFQLVGEGTRHWGKAERCYHQALELIPSNGNPHNQLAVVATYTNNNLAAVHRYFRSLAVSGTPFATALQNLQLIFTKNHSKVGKYKEKDLAAGVTPNYDTYISDLKRADTFIVKLYGMLYTGGDLELFPVIERSVVRKLDALFFRPMRQSVRRFSDLEKHRFSNFAMQVLTGCIFLVHHTCKGADDARRPQGAGVSGVTGSGPEASAFPSGQDRVAEVSSSVGDGAASFSTVEGGGRGVAGIDADIGTDMDTSTDTVERDDTRLAAEVGSLRAGMTAAQRTVHAYACTLVFDFMWLVVRSVDKETLTLARVVAVFCHWLQLYPSILSPDTALVSESELASRRALWAALATLVNQLLTLDDIDQKVATRHEILLHSLPDFLILPLRTCLGAPRTSYCTRAD
jgi:hypothetical protein